MKVNKFKKQLIAVGLSAVTAVTMVSTVFADEETTNPNTTDSTTQVQTVSEMTTKTVTVNYVKKSDSSNVGTTQVLISGGLDDGKEYLEVWNALRVPTGYQFYSDLNDISAGPEITKNSDGSYTAYLVATKSVKVVIKKSDDTSYQENKTVYVREDLNESQEKNQVVNNLSNVVPTGYTFESNGLVRNSDGSYTLTVNKTSGSTDTDAKITYTLKRAYYGEKDYLPSKVDNITFSYSSTATEDQIRSYIKSNYIPEGYNADEVGISHITIDGDMCTVRLLKNTGKVTDSSDVTFDYSKRIHYEIEYIDSETKESLGDATGSSVYRENGELNEVSALEIEYLPKGYVFDGDSFKVTGTSYEMPLVTVYVKKGESSTKTKVKINYIANVNGTLKRVCAKEFYAQDYDKNSDGQLTNDEISSLIPNGYKLDSTLNDIVWEWASADSIDYKSRNDLQVFSLGYGDSEIVRYLEPLADVSTNESSDSKATLDDTQALTTLVDSLKGDLKKTYDNAINEGKKVEFVPTVTIANLDSKSEKAVKVEASKLGYSSVEVFDITLAMNIDGEQAGTITETTSPLTFKVTIPETLKKDGRKFYVLRYHDGEVTRLDVSEDGTFTTDKFSVYMLVYEDVKTIPADNKKEDSDKSNTDKTESDSSKTNLISTKDNKKTTTDAKKNKGVNTSTRTNSSLFVGFGALALTGAAIVGVLKKKNELD